MINSSSIIVCTENLISSDIDDETVILSIQHGKYYGLNSTSAYIWKLLQSPISIHQLCKNLENIFDVDQTQCLYDVLNIVTIFFEKKLIEIVYA